MQTHKSFPYDPEKAPSDQGEDGGYCHKGSRILFENVWGSQSLMMSQNQNSSFAYCNIAYRRLKERDNSDISSHIYIIKCCKMPPPPLSLLVVVPIGESVKAGGGRGGGD